MKDFDPAILKNLYKPASDSHKGQNGKLMIIGGSHLFHAASLWSLQVASRIVDMVFYSSVDSNNEIVQKAKEEFRNGIVVTRNDLESYIQEADAVLLGPGMVRSSKFNPSAPLRAGVQSSKQQLKVQNLSEIDKITDEGEQTYFLTKYLLEKYPNKKWVLDAGALQMMEPEWLKQLNGNVIVTPHKGEFLKLFQNVIPNSFRNPKEILNQVQDDNIVSKIAKKYNCIILLKGQADVICSPTACVTVAGGNAGMTKGGTGDVLAGLVAALACKNDMWLATIAGSYINKKAGDELAKRVGFNFNASDLALEIPTVMHSL